MLPSPHNEPDQDDTESEERPCRNAPPHHVLERRPAGSMRAAVDLCAEALIQAMINARNF